MRIPPPLKKEALEISEHLVRLKISFVVPFLTKALMHFFFHTDIERLKYKQGPDHSNRQNEAAQKPLLWLHGTWPTYVGQDHVQPLRF